jgi:uncharacterized protein (TIGR02646 family)
VIRLQRPDEAAVLPQHTRRYLADRQQQAASFAPGSPAIAAAWSAFLRTRARKDVERALNGYSHTKCAYCEQIAAKDIEHFYPKANFPQRMFRWDNFLRGCKNCNNAKLARFPMDAQGQPLLVDPTADEPFHFLRWDFQTGQTLVNPTEPQRTRGETTRGLFDLDQEPLCEERRKKLLLVEYLLARVVREVPVSHETRDRLRDELAPERPWLAILRQLFTFPNGRQPLLDAARQKLPEIDAWIAVWL